MDWVTIIGIFAATASVTSFAPQAWRIIRTRETEGLSVGMYALTVFGFACWSAFGMMKGEWTIIVPNILCLALSAFVLTMLLLPAPARDKVADAIDPDA
jgi:MtN3 and saliva related transmembrane protein